MKRIILSLWALVLMSTSSFASITVYFSPRQNCEKPFVDMIAKAHKIIRISCFGLTNPNIYKALLDAHQRGVKILVCEDKMQAGGKHDYSHQMAHDGIENVIKKTHVLEHNKMMTIDGLDGIMGSWNLSNNAQSQDNGIAVFKDEPDFVAQMNDDIEFIYKRDKL